MNRRPFGFAIIAALAAGAMACGAAGTAATDRSGIAGIVVAGPQCPAEEIGHPCPPRPVAATVTVTDHAGEPVKTFTSDTNGRFRLDLPAGTYRLITTQGGQPQLLHPIQVIVEAGRYTELRVLLDTGIR